MKKEIALFCLLAFMISPSKACLNYFYTVDAKGNLHEEADVRRGFNTNFNKKKIVLKLAEAEKKLKKEHAYTHLSDYAILLMKLGKVKESLRILSVLSYNYPDDYRIASNLGTAYELNGEIDSALKYIKRGLVLNPNDHEGSEWVHVKVLETKMKLKSDPSYLDHSTVLQLSEEQEKDSVTAWQINVQARERFPFSPGPDPVMASLLIDLADCYANTSSLEFAKAVYQVAGDYYGAPKDEIEKKKSHVQKLLNKYINVNPVRPPLDHGEHSRLGNISAKHLLDNNDPDNYQVDWEKINTDPDSLLAYVDLEIPQVNIPENEPEAPEISPEKTITVKTAAVDGEGGSSRLLIYLAAGALLLVAVIWMMKR